MRTRKQRLPERIARWRTRKPESSGCERRSRCSGFSSTTHSRHTGVAATCGIVPSALMYFCSSVVRSMMSSGSAPLLNRYLRGSFGSATRCSWYRSCTSSS